MFRNLLVNENFMKIFKQNVCALSMRETYIVSQVPSRW